MGEPDLPDLKSKDRERKRAGAAWNLGGPGASPFSGATGGAGAAGTVAGARGGAGALLRSLAATLGGKLALAGALAVVMGGTLALGHRLLFGSAASRTGGTPDLGALSATVRPRRPTRSKALDYLSAAYKGELNLEPQSPAAAKALLTLTSSSPQPASPSEPSAETEAPSAAVRTDWAMALADGRWRRDTLKHDLSGAKLSDSPGGRFGGKDVFSGAQAPKFGAGFDREKLLALKAPPVQNGKPGGFKTAPAPKGTAAGTPARLGSKRAIGQLKGARALSTMAQSARADEGARALAAGAFDGKVADGGTAPAKPGETGGAGVVTPLGSGAPLPEAEAAQGRNATPYQNDLDNAYKEGAQAGDMKKQSVVLMILGLALIALGAKLMAAHPIIGASLIAVGAGLIGMSLMLLMTANSLAKQARATGEVIQRQYGQANQNKIVDECMDQAITDGTRPENCRPQTQAPDFASTAGADAKAEAASGYTVDDGNGSPVTPARPAAAPAKGP